MISKEKEKILNNNLFIIRGNDNENNLAIAIMYFINNFILIKFFINIRE